MIGMTCAVVIPINILLLIGTIKAIDWPLIVWLVVHALVLGFQVYNIFATFHIGMPVDIDNLLVSDIRSDLSVLRLFLVIYIYMWFVVYSHLIELSELSEADSPQNVQPDDLNPEE
ncbi:unnamed protein product, partial [Timema podura]|nr:unnamed protein product [Timema podura]